MRVPISIDRESRRPPLWPFLAMCALVAGWIDFGTLHRHHNGDSIVLVLVSLQRWTPFFWEADRLGMLIPLLALPFRNPLANLLVQAWLGIFSGLASAFLLARYAIDDVWWPAVAILADLFVILLTSHSFQLNWFMTNIYAPSLALGLAGLILAEGRDDQTISRLRTVLAAAFLVAAHWENLGIVLALVPLVILRHVSGAMTAPVPEPASAANRRRLESLLIRASRLLRAGFLQSPARRTLAPILLSAVAGRLAMCFVTARGHYWSLMPPNEWPIAWVQLARGLWIAAFSQAYPPLLLGVLAFAGMALLLSVPALRAHAPRFLGAASAMAAVALFYGLLVGTLVYVVKMNAADFRYVLIPFVLLITVLASLTVAPLAMVSCRTSPGLPCFVASILMLVAAGYGYGRPSLQRVRSDLASTLGGMSKDVLDSGATVVAGDYWKIWPTVFTCNLILYERGDNRRVYGLAYRSSETHRFWAGAQLKDLRVATPPDDPEAQTYFDKVGLPLALTERRSTIALFRLPRPCDAGISALDLSFQIPRITGLRRRFSFLNHTFQLPSPGLKPGFPFLVMAKAGPRCWQDSEQSSLIGSKKEITAEWSGGNLAGTLRSTVDVVWPPALGPGDTRPLEAIVSEPPDPGTYDFRLVELDHKPIELPAKQVVLVPPLASNSANSPRSLSAEYAVEEVSPVCRAGERQRIKFRARNSGSAVWLSIHYRAGSVMLDYAWYNSGRERVGEGKIRPAYSVYPEDSYTFIAGVDAPKVPGNYLLELELVAYRILRFRDAGVRPIEVSVTVVP